MQQIENTQSPIPELITRKELGKRLGISQPTVLRLDREGRVKSFRVGGQVRYRWDEIFAELQKNPGYRGR
jgi:excisionase family DNA binding protein